MRGVNTTHNYCRVFLDECWHRSSHHKIKIKKGSFYLCLTEGDHEYICSLQPTFSNSDSKKGFFTKVMEASFFKFCFMLSALIMPTPWTGFGKFDFSTILRSLNTHFEWFSVNWAGRRSSGCVIRLFSIRWADHIVFY